MSGLGLDRESLPGAPVTPSAGVAAGGPMPWGGGVRAGALGRRGGATVPRRGPAGPAKPDATTLLPRGTPTQWGVEITRNSGASSVCSGEVGWGRGRTMGPEATLAPPLPRSPAEAGGPRGLLRTPWNAAGVGAFSGEVGGAVPAAVQCDVAGDADAVSWPTPGNALAAVLRGSRDRRRGTLPVNAVFALRMSASSWHSASCSTPGVVGDVTSRALDARRREAVSRCSSCRSCRTLATRACPVQKSALGRNSRGVSMQPPRRPLCSRAKSQNGSSAGCAGGSTAPLLRQGERPAGCPAPGPSRNPTFSSPAAPLWAACARSSPGDGRRRLVPAERFASAAVPEAKAPCFASDAGAGAAL